MTDKLSNARLTDFLKNGPIEVSSGGKPETSWWRRKVTALIAGIGIMFSLAMAPAMGAEKPNKKAKTATTKFLDGFQKKLDGARGDQTLVFLDHKRASESAAYILSTVSKYLKRDGRSLKTLNSILLMKRYAKQSATGFLMRQPVYKNADPKNINYRFAMAVGNMPKIKRDELKMLLAGVPNKIIFNDRFSTTYEGITRAVCYHEAFGHGTESRDIYMMQKNRTYVRHLQELRADIAAMVGTTRDTGSTSIAQDMCHLRTLGTFNNAYGVIKHNAFQYMSGIYSYNIGPGNQKAINIMNDILAQPGGKDMIMGLDDAGVVKMTNTIFEKVRPNEETFQLQNTAVFGAAACAQNKMLMVAPGAIAPAAMLFRSNSKITLHIQSFLGYVDRAEKALLQKDFIKKPRRVAWAEQTRLLQGHSARKHVAAPSPKP